jgi:hypothetical protein
VAAAVKPMTRLLAALALIIFWIALVGPPLMGGIARLIRG